MLFTTVTLCICHKPSLQAPELPYLEGITPEHIRAFGQRFHADMDHTADLLQKLLQDGCHADRAEYDIYLTHPNVDTEQDAKDRLQALGIDPEEVCIWEDDDPYAEEEEDAEAPATP
jgi:hypothetical protein